MIPLRSDVFKHTLAVRTGDVFSPLANPRLARNPHPPIPFPSPVTQKEPPTSGAIRDGPMNRPFASSGEKRAMRPPNRAFATSTAKQRRFPENRPQHSLTPHKPAQQGPIIRTQHGRAVRALFSKNRWCPGWGSNPHAFRGRRILSPLRLPIPPPGHESQGKTA